MIKRKLLLTGRYTYMLTLPKEWVKKLGWRSKQMLALDLEDNRIILRDFPNLPAKTKSAKSKKLKS